MARLTLALLLVATTGIISAFSPTQAQCTDVHVVFARGSGELPGLGICGQPLVSDITSALQGMTVSSHAVQYMADVAQTSAGPGATAMTNHVVQVAQACPSTMFVLGGYSQGASVTDIALGIRTTLGSGQSIPQQLAPRIKAVVTFGNPLKLTGGTIASQSQLYGPKAIEFCAMGDPVCGGGMNFMAHTGYPMDGSVTKAAQQAAQLVRQGAATTTTQGQGIQQGQAASDQSSLLPGTSASTGPNIGGAGGFPSLRGGGFPGLNGGGFPGLGGIGAGAGTGTGTGTGNGALPSFGFDNLLRRGT